MNKNKKNGYALLTALLVLGIMSVIVLGVNLLVIANIKKIKLTEDSIAAYYVAESGTEKILYEDRKGTYDPLPGDVGSVLKTGSLSTGGSYSVVLMGDSPTSIKVIGTFRQVKRALELNYDN